MIFSKAIGQYIPVQIKVKHYDNIAGYTKMTNYDVFDRYRKVGYVHLSDLHNGCYVDFIKNEAPELYKGFSAFADQIEVEHCLNRGLDKFEIRSCAALNSHALHYLRGKRFLPVLDAPSIKRLTEKFGSTDVNEIVKNIIEKTPVGEQYNTRAIGDVRMYMPKDIIDKYIKLSKESPILSGANCEYLA